jgi:hypothetical protein
VGHPRALHPGAGEPLPGLQGDRAVRAGAPLRTARHGLVVVARAADPARAIDAIARMPARSGAPPHRPAHPDRSFEGQEIDVRVATPDEYGSVLFTTTGPPRHVADVLKRRGPS